MGTTVHEKRQNNREILGNFWADQTGETTKDESGGSIIQMMRMN